MTSNLAQVKFPSLAISPHLSFNPTCHQPLERGPSMEHSTSKSISFLLLLALLFSALISSHSTRFPNPYHPNKGGHSEVISRWLVSKRFARESQFTPPSPEANTNPPRGP